MLLIHLSGAVVGSNCAVVKLGAGELPRVATPREIHLAPRLSAGLRHHAMPTDGASGTPQMPLGCVSGTTSARRGGSVNVTLRTLERLCTGFDVDVRELF